jgi:hypothetical protein
MDVCVYVYSMHRRACMYVCMYVSSPIYVYVRVWARDCVGDFWSTDCIHTISVNFSFVQLRHISLRLYNN